jgi:hypothetical protein
MSPWHQSMFAELIAKTREKYDTGAKQQGSEQKQ